jgi:HPr kinase/phosphorylase
VADDVVDICRIAKDQLLGASPENVRHFMEVRGIGIIDVRQMFGIGSVMLQKSIDMVAELELWDNSKQYDRLGLDDITEELLDVAVPKVVLPVMPGRNLAIVMEVAARNHRLKNMGYNSALELHRRINERIGGLGGF